MHAFYKPEASRNRYSGKLVQDDGKERARRKERKEWRTRKKRKRQSKVKTLWKRRLSENESFPSILMIQSHLMCVPSLLSISLPFFSDTLTPCIYLGPHVTWMQWGLQCPSQGQSFLHLPNCTLKFSHCYINHILTVFMRFCTTWILASRMMVLSGKYNCASAQLYSAIRHQNCWLYKINGREEGHCGIITHTAECPHFRMLWWTAHWLRIFVEQCTKAPWRKFIV